MDAFLMGQRGTTDKLKKDWNVTYLGSHAFVNDLLGYGGAGTSSEELPGRNVLSYDGILFIDAFSFRVLLDGDGRHHLWQNGGPALLYIPTDGGQVEHITVDGNYPKHYYWDAYGPNNLILEQITDSTFVITKTSISSGNTIYAGTTTLIFGIKYNS